MLLYKGSEWAKIQEYGQAYSALKLFHDLGPTGPGVSAVNNFQEGNYGWATFDATLAVLPFLKFGKVGGTVRSEVSAAEKEVSVVTRTSGNAYHGVEFISDELRMVEQPLAAAVGKTTSTSSLIPTHYITSSKTQMQGLLNDIKVNGIKESIKYVEYKGSKYIVDGHHRFYAAQRLGIKNVPVEQVKLPYGSYKEPMNLMMEPGRQPGFWKNMK